MNEKEKLFPMFKWVTFISKPGIEYSEVSRVLGSSGFMSDGAIGRYPGWKRNRTSDKMDLLDWITYMPWDSSSPSVPKDRQYAGSVFLMEESARKVMREYRARGMIPSRNIADRINPEFDFLISSVSDIFDAHENNRLFSYDVSWVSLLG